MSNSEILLTGLQEDIRTALKAWHQPDTDPALLDDLQLFQQARLAGDGSSRQAANNILLDALEVLEIKDETGASLLRKRFLDGLAGHIVANQLNIGESTAYRKQQEAIKQLAQIIRDREMQARSSFQAGLEKALNLPPGVELIGVEEDLQTLLAVLGRPESPWLISIEGLGGIGKTALANALVRQPALRRHFYKLAWVSAKQRELRLGTGMAEMDQPTLTAEALTDALLAQLGDSVTLAQSPHEKRLTLIRLLKDAPYLIVVDNLETMVDYETLLPALRELANPGKFLLTSRHSLRTHPNVFCHSLTELNRAEALRFIRHEATVRGLSLLADAPEADLDRIYEIAGGHPLALKLVIGQISVLPLSEVLDNLKQARSKTIDELYSYIYWQAWHMLDEAGRQVLLVMPLAQGGVLDQLLALSRLEPDELNRAIEQLAGLSLLQIGGGLDERRYTIHRLTETFLLNEAIKWQSQP